MWQQTWFARCRYGGNPRRDATIVGPFAKGGEGAPLIARLVRRPVVVRKFPGNPLKTDPRAQTMDNKRIDQEVLSRGTPNAHAAVFSVVEAIIEKRHVLGVQMDVHYFQVSAHNHFTPLNQCFRVWIVGVQLDGN